jgi:hypothetical protein
MSALPDLERDLLAAADRWLPQRETPIARRTRWIRVAVGAAALAGVAAGVAVVLVVTVGGQSQALALAARAYKQTTVIPGQILYTRAVVITTITDAKGTRQRDTDTIQDWHRSLESHRLEIVRSHTGKVTAALDHVVSADGVMRQIDEQGGYRIVRPSDNHDASEVIADQQAGLIGEFRRRYEESRLKPAGDVEFAGRPAFRYTVIPKPPIVAPGLRRHEVPPPVEPDENYYVDRETGMPLGFTGSMAITVDPRGGVPQPGITTSVETVQAIERLAPTSSNLAKLHRFVLPRRRDADGCIRGPVQQARTSDRAPKYDCGGTPRAIVRIPVR